MPVSSPFVSHGNSDGVERRHAAILYSYFCHWVQAEGRDAHNYIPSPEDYLTVGMSLPSCCAHGSDG